MKVCFLAPSDSRGLMRIYSALTKHAPDYVDIVSSVKKADLVVMFVIGRLDRTSHLAEQILTSGKGYALIQVSLRRTLRPSTSHWIALWGNSRFVWSTYDLRKLCYEDGVEPDFNFHYDPFGVDSGVFYPRKTGWQYKVATSGLSWLTESVREVVMAARRVGGSVFHVGPHLNFGGDVYYSNGMSDKALAQRYSGCDFVSGLRRVEGFELPAAEGLLCGARPIMFDRHHYREWFGEFARFIPERSREDVVNDVESIFLNDNEPVTEEEIEKARKRFDWKDIAKGFWYAARA